MQYVVTGKEMKAIDTFSIQEIGIPSLVLMERAACMLSWAIEEKEKKTVSIGIVSGMGNNGADGLAAARILREKGFSNVTVWAVGNREHATKEWFAQYHIIKNLGIPLYFYGEPETEDFSSCEILVDGLFGIGLTREITGIYREVIEKINAASAKVYAVDIPSGICAEDGRIMGIAVKADITVTFGFLKAGCILYPGAEYSGKVEVYPIGFPDKAVEQISPSFVIYGREDLNRLPARPARSNKGTFGKVLLAAGSPNMAGAAYLAARAAYGCGAGLVRILTAEENRIVLQTLIPEAILTTWESGRERDYYRTIARECCQWATVGAAGPGLGTSKEAAWMCEAVLDEMKNPLVLDADGLNLLASHPDWKKKNQGNWILTPHLGEMGRLLGKPVKEIADHLPECAKELAKTYEAVAVCKDARTIVESGGVSTYINISGNSAMAKGGSGDVLTGVLVGLLAGKSSFSDGTGMRHLLEETARLGVYIHGLAGDLVQEKKGAYSLMASDLTDALGELLRGVK